jgi:hypothetical protein
MQSINESQLTSEAIGPNRQARRDVLAEQWPCSGRPPLVESRGTLVEGTELVEGGEAFIGFSELLEWGVSIVEASEGFEAEELLIILLLL